jgi:hypothetical protein
MGELGVLFNPGMRHEREEKLAKQMLREDEGTGRKGRLGIDLESGVVVINSTTARPADESAAPKAPAEHSETNDADEPESNPRPAGTSGADRASSVKPVSQRNGSRAAQRSSAAVPSGKARRAADTADRGKPTGKSRRGSR